QGAFATAAAADQGDELLPLDVQINVTENRAGAERLCHTHQLDIHSDGACVTQLARYRLAFGASAQRQNHLWTVDRAQLIAHAPPSARLSRGLSVAVFGTARHGTTRWSSQRTALSESLPSSA